MSDSFILFFLDLLLTVDNLPGRASCQVAARRQNSTGVGVGNNDEHQDARPLNLVLVLKFA